MQRIKKGDTVEVIAGRDLGDRGEVITVLPKRSRVIVSGVNTQKKHYKARQVGNQQIPAQIADIDAPIHVSNVMLICPACEQRTRVGFVVHEDGSKERVCKKCKATFV